MSSDVLAAGIEESTEALTKLETIIVTGSRIASVDEEGPTPITVITREQIDKLGYSSLRDVLGNLTMASGGSFDVGRSFSLGKGTQSVNLRGLGAGRALVLLDGRRLPVSPQGLNGTDAFVDLSTLSMSSVERVEILRDGASAIYGSDAISGVINIITRKSFTGTEMIARASGTEDGGGSAQRYQFLHGIRSAAGSIQLVGDYTRQHVLRQSDRDFSASDFGNGGLGSLGSTFLADDGRVIADPGCGTPADAIGGLGVLGADGFCRFDRSQFRQWIPEGERGSLQLRADRRLGEIDTFLRAAYFRGRQRILQEPAQFAGGDSLPFARSRIIPGNEFPAGKRPGYVPVGASNNPTMGTAQEAGGFFQRRLVEFGLRGFDLTTESFNGLAGASGHFGRYRWDVGMGHNEVRMEGVSPTVLSSVLDDQVSNGGLDLFAPIPISVVNGARHERVQRGISRNSTLDGTLSGPVGFVLPGGPVEFALHADYEDERYTDKVDPITQVGDTLEPGSSGGGDRKYTGVGAEFRLPVMEKLELGVAGRFDHYDDASSVGSAFSPSIRAGFRPWSILLLRASWGESFRAPDMQRLFGANSVAFGGVVDTPRCTAAGGAPGVPVNAADQNDPCKTILNVPTLTGSNRDLKEEKGDNFNIGFVVEPLRKLNFRVDYFEIKVKDLVATLTAQQLLDLCATTGEFCDQIRRNPQTGLIGTPQAGGDNQALLSAVALNLARQEVHGYDLGTSYEFESKGLGTFSGDFDWSHLTSLRVRSLPNRPEVQQIGFGQTVRVPQDRFSLTLDWDLARYGMTVRADRVGKYPGAGGLIKPATDQQYVNPYTTVNLQGRVDFGRFGLIRLGIDNLLDEDFPIDPTFLPGSTNTQNQFIVGATNLYANPLGRQGYLQYELRF